MACSFTRSYTMQLPPTGKSANYHLQESPQTTTHRKVCKLPPTGKSANYHLQESLQDKFIKAKKNTKQKLKETIKCAVLIISTKNFEQFLGLTLARCPAHLTNKWVHFQHLLPFVAHYNIQQSGVYWTVHHCDS